jgi:hypothetical protein
MLEKEVQMIAMDGHGNASGACARIEGAAIP